MKKILNKINDFHFSKYQFLLLLFVPVLMMFAQKITLDNDTWYLLNTGRYIFNHGISRTLIFTIHNGFDMLMQNWGGTLIFYTIYKYFNYFGLFVFIILLFSIIIYLYFKITYLISEKKLELSVLITVISMLIFGKMFVVMRTQMFTFINILLLIYSLELYIKTNKSKYLIILPVISLLQINIHVAFWIMLFLICLPYIIDSFKFSLFGMKSQGYRKKPLIIAIILMFLVGFINPYGIDAMNFLFHSVSYNMSESIIELKSINIHNFLGLVMFTVIALFYTIYFLISKKKIRVRYLLLMIGTSILAIYSIRSFSLFLLCSSFSLGYMFKDIIKESNDKLLKYSKNKKIIHYVSSTFIFISITIILFFNIKCDFSSSMEKSINYLLNNYNKKNIQLYTNFNNGSYAEFRGVRCYIDPRAEAFLKANNHKYDVYSEMLKLNNGQLNPKKFLNKYNFTHLLIDNNYDYVLDLYLKETDNKYKLVYKDKYNKIYVRNDIKKNM